MRTDAQIPDAAVEPSLLEALMPTYDAVRAESVIVPGAPEQVYRVVRDADLLHALTGSRSVQLLFGLRTAAERAYSWLRRRPLPPEPPPPETMRLGELDDRGEWVCLADQPPMEFAFGAVGKFWAGETCWLKVTNEELRHFTRPGYGIIMSSIRVAPAGPGACRVVYEVRTATTDEVSRRAFRRYWRVVSPFVGVVMRSMLGVIAEDAARAPGR